MALRTVHIAATVVAACLLAVAYTRFPHAMPHLNVKVSMDRAAALQRSAELVDEHQLLPNGHTGSRPMQAVMFGGDQVVQTFVELDAGGVSVFRSYVLPTVCGGVQAADTRWQHD